MPTSAGAAQDRNRPDGGVSLRSRSSIDQPAARERSSLQLLLKRAVDIIGASFGLVLASPLLLAAAAAVRFDSPGPCLFRQRRAGLRGEPFLIFKLRTMKVCAEDRLRDNEALNIMEGPRFKLIDDPRVTPIGRLLRKFSIDEIPQFVNVLRGEMSLVGPRPFPISEMEGYEERHWRRFSVKPGMTGLWQVTGRATVRDFERIVELDLEYIQAWSLLLDLKILLRTIGTVVSGRGAY